MGRLRNTRTGETYEVPDVDAVQAARQDPDLEVVGDVAVSPQSRFPGAAVAADPNAEATPEADVAGFYRAQEAEREHDTALSRTKAALGGGAQELSLGFVNPWREDQEFHPGYALGGRVGGIAATLLVPGAGEENLARAGAEGIAEAAGAAREAGSIGRTVGRAVGYTPLGLATRAGEAVGGLVRGASAGARIARAAVTAGTAGGAIGLGTELSRQLLDSDAAFSGEALVGAAAHGALLGGVLGAAGGTLTEGLGALGRRLSGRGESAAPEALAPEEYAARAEARAPTPYREALDAGPPRPPLAPMLDPRNVTLVDAVASRARDLGTLESRLTELQEAPALARSAGLSREYLIASQGTVARELAGLKSLSRFEDAPLARIAEDAHANDLIGVRLARETERIPPRWSDAEQRAADVSARDRALDALAERRARGEPVSQAEEDAVRYSVQLSSGRPPAQAAEVGGSLLAGVARRIIDRVPGGRLIGTTLGVAAPVGIAEHLVTHGVTGLLGHAVLPVAAVGVGVKAVRAAFRDPIVGGIVAADAAHVLDSTGVLRGERPRASADPRRALRDLGDRVRTVTPAQVRASVVASLSHAAGASPTAVAQAGVAAANRHAALLAALDRADPMPTTPGQALLGRPLPTASAARGVADLIRMASSPAAFLVAASRGRLTPAMMSQSESVWPATVRRARAELTARLSRPGVGDRLGPTERRMAELVLGRDASMGQLPRSTAYSAAMRSSAVASAAPPAPPPGGPRPGVVPTRPPAPTPAVRAANPGTYR
jgi:hypothetical protein